MSFTAQWVKEIAGRKIVFISDGKTACVRYKRYGHTYNFGGPVEDKQAVLRMLGSHASDLLDPFQWSDAVIVRDAINGYWPDVVEKEEICQCHACRCRRDADYEAEQVTEWKPKKKIDWLGVVFIVMTLVRTKLRNK